MEAQQLSNGNNEDKDITDVIVLVKKTFYWIISHLFKGIEYCIKYWWVLLLLILAGSVLGYFTGNSKSYKSTLIIQTNFTSQAYVYNAIDQINQNLREGDQEFIKALSEGHGTFNITSLEIEPVVDIVNVMAKIQLSDKSLNTIFAELNQKGDKELFSTDLFNQNYKYHKLELTLSSEDSENSINAIVDYLNEQPYAVELMAESVKNLDDRIKENERTLEQINEVIAVYAKSMEFTTSSSDKMAFYNNQSNLSMQEVFEFKTDLSTVTEYLKNGRIGQAELVMIVSSPETSLDDSLLSKKVVKYPLILVLIFLLLSLMNYTYSSLRNQVREQKSN